VCVCVCVYIYIYVVLCVLMNVVIILISLSCIRETQMKYLMTVFVIKPVVSLGVTFYIGIGDVSFAVELFRTT
jgi:hypothetical protein